MLQGVLHGTMVKVRVTISICPTLFIAEIDLMKKMCSLCDVATNDIGMVGLVHEIPAVSGICCGYKSPDSYPSVS